MVAVVAGAAAVSAGEAAAVAVAIAVRRRDGRGGARTGSIATATSMWVTSFGGGSELLVGKYRTTHSVYTRTQGPTGLSC